MKILQVTAVDFTVEKFLGPLIECLQSNGHEVHIACSTETSTETLHAIDFERKMISLNHFKAIKQLVKLLKKEHYDVVHTHTPVASVLARIAAKIAGVPTIIYTAHGFYFHENMPRTTYQLTYFIEKMTSKLATDYIFFQSEEDFKLALDAKFLPPKRLVHIQNGVDARKFDPARYDREAIRQQLGLASDEYVFIFVGRLVKEKGIEELLEAFQRTTGGNATLLVVGDQVKGDRDHSSVRKDQSNIQYLGLREDIPELLAASDCFVLPSYREGMPRSIIEAMAMKLPVITTNIRGCREEVVHEQTGLLCEPQNSDALHEQLAWALAHTEEMKQMGESGRQRFLKLYDEEKVLARQMEVYHLIAHKDGLEVVK